MNSINAPEMEAIAKKAADAALQELFLVLGVDIEKPQALLELQADLRHARYMREFSGLAGRRAVNSVISLIIGGALLAIAQSFGWSFPKVP